MIPNFFSARLRVFIAVAAFVAWSAVLLQFVLSLQLAVANGKGVVGGIVIFFGYFTILTNILVALALSAPLIAPNSALGRFFGRPGVATMVAAAITVVCLAYFFLLRNVWDPEGWQFVADAALHYVTPALFLLYWWFAVPKDELRWVDLPKWTVYPVAYLVYALVRGALTGLYPYHFIDVNVIGYGAALANAVGIMIGFSVVAALLVAVSRFQPPKPAN